MYKPEVSYEEFLKKEQEKYPELNVNDIETLKSKVQANENLPAIRDKSLVLFLHKCYFDVEKTYKMIVAHYKYRRDVSEVFTAWDPLADDMKKVFDGMSICSVTNADTGKKDRIVVTNFKNTDPEAYEYVPCCRYLFMLLEYMLATNGGFDGLIVVMNSKGMNWRHISKTPMTKMKKLLGYVQEALPVRLKEVHILNAGSMVTVLFNIIRPFMRNGLMDLVTIYPENSPEVFKKVPIELMPVEIGGTGKSHVEYNDDMYKLLVDARDFFLSLPPDY